MSRLVRNIIAGICLLSCSLGLQAQVLVRASIDRDKIVVGDSLLVTLDVRAPLGQEITWFALDTIPHFEFIGKGKIDTADNADGKKLVQQIVLTSYDSGSWQIPMLPIKIGDKTYYSDSVAVEVGYANADLSQDYKDIKEIQDVPNTDTNYIPWVIGGVTLLAIIILVIIFLRKPKKTAPAAAPVIRLTPYDEALKALADLKKEDLPARGEVKAFYTRLNDILRDFVHRKLMIATAEKTNEELIRELKKQRMHEEYYRELTNALRVADFVKFARYQPTAEDNDKNYDIIESAIKTLNNIA